MTHGICLNDLPISSALDLFTKLKQFCSGPCVSWPDGEVSHSVWPYWQSAQQIDTDRVGINAGWTKLEVHAFVGH